MAAREAELVRARTREVAGDGLQVLMGMMRKGLQVEVFNYNLALRSSRWVSAWDLLQGMRRRLRPDAVSFCSCLKGSSWRWACQLLTTIRSMQVEVNLVLSNAGMATLPRWHLSLAHLLQMLRSPDLISHTLAIRSLAKGRKWTQAVLQLGEMRASRVEMDTLSLNLLLQSGGSRWRLGLNLLENLRVVPTVVTYNMLLAFCSWQLGLLVLKDMALQLDTISYNSVMRSCAEGGRWDIALQLLREASVLKVADVVSHSTAIDALARSAQWQRALEALLVMRAEHGVRPNAFSFTGALKACGAASRWQLTLEVRELMAAQSVAGDALFGNLAAGFARLGRWQHGLRVMSSFGAEMALKALEEGLRWQQGLQVLGILRQVGLQQDMATLTSACRACGKGAQSAWQRALGWFSRRGPRGWDLAACNALISTAAEAGAWSFALGCLRRLRRRALRPQEVTCSAAITACEKGRTWRFACGLLEEMDGMEGAETDGVGTARDASQLDGGSGSGEMGPGEIGNADGFPGNMGGTDGFPSKMAGADGFPRPLDGSSGFGRCVVACDAAISACEKCGQWRGALAVLASMGRTPNEITFNAVFTSRIGFRIAQAIGACEKGQLDMA
ncbi:unnamed protein product [Effrenium voratum]|nr:unnamed protein product [Effrenium voratum]